MATYKNTKTGFVFNSPCEIKAEGWVKLNPKPFSNEKESKEEKPVKKTSKSK